MSVQQLYYTSWVDTPPGDEVGFHVRGMSPGITPEDQRLLTDLVTYMIPPRLDPRQIATHPVALRYKYLSPDKAVLLCSQSTGNDEQGRTGNFFAHAIILDPEPFTRTPPALYWGSPFWRASDSTPGDAIPALPSFDVEPSLDLDRVWRFIADTQRRDWLYRLLCAVIHCSTTQRRVVIVDTSEHVALWVAAISLMLPSRYRPLLSFATYHNDPYQAGYLITGTRSDVDFRLTPSDFLSFFTLDTETERVSEIAESAYARFAADCARPKLYSERMLGLLSMCDRLFPPDGAIGDQLDDAAAYYARVIAKSGPLDSTARRAMTRAITTLDQTDTLSDERLEGLQELHTLLVSTLAETPEPELIRDYERVTSMMRAADSQGVSARLPRDLWLVTQLIVTGKTREGTEVSEIVQRVYGDTAVISGLNSPEYLRELTGLSESASLPAMLGVWWFVGKSVKATPDSIPALTAMLKRAPAASGGAQAVEALADSTRSDALGWLTALTPDTSIQPETLHAYYYALVSHMPPQERAPYRALMPHAEDLPVYEIERDLSGNGVDANLDALGDWAEYASLDSDGAVWISAGLNYLWGVSARRDQPVIARYALMRPAILTQLHERSIGTLLHTAFSGLPLARPNAADLAFCQQFWQDPRLNIAERTLLIGVLAMDAGRLNHQTATELRERFSQLSAEQYATEARDFISRFFEQDVSRESHAEMVVATYNMRYNDIFWQNYGSAFLTLLIDPRMAQKTINLLGFWFDSSLSALGSYPYVVQLFFMGLPRLFEAAQKERTYRDAARDLDHYASEQHWYPLVKGMITPERKSILGRLRL